MSFHIFMHIQHNNKTAFLTVMLWGHSACSVAFFFLCSITVYTDLSQVRAVANEPDTRLLPISMELSQHLEDNHLAQADNNHRLVFSSAPIYQLIRRLRLCRDFDSGLGQPGNLNNHFYN